MTLGLFPILCKVPFFGDFLLIANAYAWEGNSAFVSRCAPFANWWRHILWKVMLCIAFSLFLFWLKAKYVVQDPQSFNSLKDVLNVFPNVLGFAVALYAFILVIPRRFWSWMRSNKTMGATPESVNADLAYPVISICLMLGIAWPMSIFEPKFPNIFIVTSFIFAYSFLLIAELVVCVFSIAHKSLKDN